MALAWVLKDERMTSVIVGASSVNQLADNLKALEHLEFMADELKEIEQIFKRFLKSLASISFNNKRMEYY